MESISDEIPPNASNCLKDLAETLVAELKEESTPQCSEFPPSSEPCPSKISFGHPVKGTLSTQECISEWRRGVVKPSTPDLTPSEAEASPESGDHLPFLGTGGLPWPGCVCLYLCVCVCVCVCVCRNWIAISIVKNHTVFVSLTSPASCISDTYVDSLMSLLESMHLYAGD